MMNTTSINSYKELELGISQNERAFLLLYKSGSDQSDCALERIQKMEIEESPSLYTADVNSVRDIHERLDISSAPSLVVFENGKKVNIIKIMMVTNLNSEGFTKQQLPNHPRIRA